MNPVFHVKPGAGACWPWRRHCAGLLAVGVVLVGIATALPTAAAIRKCTGADGKATFSDQPCASGEAAQPIKEAPRAPALAPRRPTDNASANKAMFERIKGKLPPDCARALARVFEALESGSRTSDLDAALLRWTPACEAAAEKAIARETAPQ